MYKTDPSNPAKCRSCGENGVKTTIHGNPMYECENCGLAWNRHKRRRRRKMAIKIKVKEYKKPFQGKEEVWIEVIKIEALKKDQLPESYLNQKFNIYRDTYKTGRFGKTVDALFTLEKEDVFVLRMGELYKLEDFQKRLRFVRKAGRKLHKINSAIKSSKKEKKEAVKYRTFEV